MIFRPASHPFYFSCRKVGGDPQLRPETPAGMESSKRRRYDTDPQLTTDIQIEGFREHIRSADDITICSINIISTVTCRVTTGDW